MSLSARRAWIEIIGLTYDGLIASVALRKESVDRNYTVQIIVVIMYVALRKESVDRNLLGVGCLIMIGVALRKESVDRNHWFDL